MALPHARIEIINLRASTKEKTLIDRAAELRQTSRSEFMLQAACREAEAILLDQHHFVLSGETYDRFLARLDESPIDNKNLRKLLQSKAPWER